MLKFTEAESARWEYAPNREGFLRDRMQLPFQTVCLCLSIFCCFGSGVSLRALFFGSLL
ncbi:MAG: hypothetical protein ACLR8L_16180 [Oscillospiraceae bacterium]